MFIYSSKSTVKNNHQINLQVEHKIKKRRCLHTGRLCLVKGYRRCEYAATATAQAPHHFLMMLQK